MQTGVVFHIQRYSVHDGPGIRTVVFLKGCPLHCSWCSNPESQKPEPELAFQEDRCLGLSHCGLCQHEHAELSGCQDRPVLPADRTGIDDLEEICPAQAFRCYGCHMTVAEVLQEVEKDESFYTRSGGGLTLSGGEPLAQPQFALALLQEAKHRCIHTAIETCGFVPWPVLSKAALYLDYVFFDLKGMDGERLRCETGSDGRKIRENFQRLVATYPHLPIHVRTPVIPGVNDRADEIGRIAAFLQQHRPLRYELLPYHAYGRSKYRALGRTYLMRDVKLTAEHMQDLQDIVHRYGF